MVRWTDFLLSWTSCATVPHLKETCPKKKKKALLSFSLQLWYSKENAWKSESSYWQTEILPKEGQAAFFLGNNNQIFIFVSIYRSLHQNISCKKHIYAHTPPTKINLLTYFQYFHRQISGPSTQPVIHWSSLWRWILKPL